MSSSRKIFILIVFALVILLAAASYFLLFRPGVQKKSENPVDDIRKGWVEFKMGEYKRAINFFQKASDELPAGSDDCLKAQYSLACTYWLKLPDPETSRAEKLFKEIIASKPDGDYAAWSMLALARMIHIVPTGQTPDYPRVREEYLKIYNKFPDHIAGHEAFIFMIATYLCMLDKENAEFARTKLEEFLKIHPDSPYVSSAWGLLSTACGRLKLKDEMLKSQIKSLETLELDRTNPRMDKSNRYWNIAVIAEFEAGDFKTARKYYGLFMEEYPNDRRNFAAHKALARMDSIEDGFRKEPGKENK